MTGVCDREGSKEVTEVSERDGSKQMAGAGIVAGMDPYK